MKAASSIDDTSVTLNGSVNPNGQATSGYFEYGTTTGYGSKTPSKSAARAGARRTWRFDQRARAGPDLPLRLVASNAAGTTAGVDATVATTGPPLVRTGSATGVGYSTATLTGSVVPSGHSTTWYFQYGTTTGYSGKTATQSAGSGLSTRSVSAALSNLAAATTYHYRLVAKSSAGTVVGADTTFATAVPASTITASATSVVFRHAAMITGFVSTRRSNERVDVYAQKLTSGSFTLAATVLTGANGSWGLAVKPSIRTVYKAVWNGSTSATVTVGVRPVITLRRLTKGRFATLVLAGRPFTGRSVQLQRRRADGSWRTISRLRLSKHSRAVFHPTLPRGRSTLRVAFSVNQAGAGYLGGFSPLLSVRR